MSQYALTSYGLMMSDTTRMDPYARALEAACRPGSVVLDIGTGAGIMALLACRAGAARVYAVEPSDVVVVAREIARANGLSDRITFIQDCSTNISLPEPVDVVVADLRGVLPMFRDSLASMIDARRLLRPDAVIIPQEDVLRVALIESEPLYDDFVAPWRRHSWGFDTSAAERLVLHTWRKVRVPADGLLTPAHDLMCLDYRTLDTPKARGTITTAVVRPGSAHGLLLWFDTRLLDGIGFSNQPGGPVALYGQAFLPLAAPVPVDAGDQMRLTVHADPMTNDYFWRWETEITSATGVVKARFCQSTFHQQLLSPARIRQFDAAARPSPGVSGAIDRLILDCLDGNTTVAAVAQRVQQQFPGRFTDQRAAHDRVRTVVARYLEETER